MSFCNYFCKRFVRPTKVVPPTSKDVSKYRGPFALKQFGLQRPTLVSRHRLEQVLEDVAEMQNKVINEPSPFHIVWRHKHIFGRPWSEKVVLRKLGLHDLKNNQPQVIPNTPFYNKLLWEIKHLIRLKPVRFPDGIPTDKDIGATKLEMYTGICKVSEAYRVSDERLNADQLPGIYVGRYLTDYLRKLSGIFQITHR